MSDVQVKDGSTYTPPTNITKTGYEFGYWATNSALTNKFTNTTITSDITLYAKWYLKYDWDDNNKFELDDLFLYRKYLAGEGDSGYSGFDASRKKALNYDNNTTISLVDLIQARIALANK
jgi:uncharacterized repeat protein (TIGR02543 family)